MAQITNIGTKYAVIVNLIQKSHLAVAVYPDPAFFS